MLNLLASSLGLKEVVGTWKVDEEGVNMRWERKKMKRCSAGNKAENCKGVGRNFYETFGGSLNVIGGFLSLLQFGVAALFKGWCCAT